MFELSRRAAIAAASSVAVSSPDVAMTLPSEPDTASTVEDELSTGASRWRIPAEEDRHERTWKCRPSSEAVWGPDLAAVQDAIIGIAQAIARFEPVMMLACPAEIEALQDIFGDDVVSVGIRAHDEIRKRVACLHCATQQQPATE
jgi:agmatine deiminase